MVKRRVIFTFSAEVVREPIIYTLSQQFNVVTNILRADLSEDSGWVVLELDGTKKNIEQGIDWVIGRGVRVDPVDEESS